MKYLNEKDILAGLMFVVIGMLGFGFSFRFDFGSTAHPGPGFFPSVISVLLVMIGLVVTVSGTLRAAETIPKFVMRPFLLISLAVVLFALSVERFGLMPAVFMTAVVASFAKSRYGTASRILNAAALAVASAVLFVGLLNLPIRLWPF